MDSYPRSTEALKREVSATGGGSLISIMRGLWPYIWPTERRDLKLRVAVAMLLLLAAKLVTIAVPFTFKWATDALTGEGSAPVVPSAWLVWALAAPIVMTIAYGGTRILMAVLTQMRDGIFAQVAMNAVRRLAYRTFEHMHQLSLRFHLQRKTGGLTRGLERGGKIGRGSGWGRGEVLGGGRSLKKKKIDSRAACSSTARRRRSYSITSQFSAGYSFTSFPYPQVSNHCTPASAVWAFLSSLIETATL